MKHIKLLQDESFVQSLEEKMTKNDDLSSWPLFQLNYMARKASLISEFSSLNSLKHLPHMSFMPHQLESVQTVIQKMNGRAILADEVGLGKTIEAGLILKEYLVRNLVKKVLILVPASLINQWVQELYEKFYIVATPYHKNFSWEQTDIAIASMDTAKRSPHREKILAEKYDLLIVDEAHKLKNEKTINYQFVSSIHKTYCLLLTATPLQNSLMEIFNLVSIIRPGLLGNVDFFKKTFGKDRRALNHNEHLKFLIQQVMIRNTRKKVSLDDVQRHVQTITVNFSKDERQFYEQLSTQGVNLPKLMITTLQREFCSSREACYMSLQNMFSKYKTHEEEIKALLSTLQELPHHQKGKKVVELINSIGKEKIVIFTEYRATQYFLQQYLALHDIVSVPFHGGFSRSKKSWMQQLFKNEAQVMIATEAGGEGINLQFCHHLINYDLPWNPLRLEQRIGRIHRIGQHNDVNIYNLIVNDTIEDHIVTLLYEKIHLFEHVIGKLDKILDTLQMSNFEHELMNIFANSLSNAEAKVKLNHLIEVVKQTENYLGDEQLLS